VVYGSGQPEIKPRRFKGSKVLDVFPGGFCSRPLKPLENPASGDRVGSPFSACVIAKGPGETLGPFLFLPRILVSAIVVGH
jgi:hypothetical protein